MALIWDKALKFRKQNIRDHVAAAGSGGDPGGVGELLVPCSTNLRRASFGSFRRATELLGTMLLARDSIWNNTSLLTALIFSSLPKIQSGAEGRHLNFPLHCALCTPHFTLHTLHSKPTARTSH